MADGEDIQPLVCDNGTGMVKVRRIRRRSEFEFMHACILIITI